MSSRELCLRKANFLDSKIIFEWRNEPLVRMNSLHTELIMYDTHLKWFQEKLLSKESQIYICMKGETPVGQIRIDYEGNKGEISYSIASEYRGKGYGKQLLQYGEIILKELGYNTIYVWTDQAPDFYKKGKDDTFERNYKAWLENQDYLDRAPGGFGSTVYTWKKQQGGSLSKED